MRFLPAVRRQLVLSPRPPARFFALANTHDLEYTRVLSQHPTSGASEKAACLLLLPRHVAGSLFLTHAHHSFAFHRGYCSMGDVIVAPRSWSTWESILQICLATRYALCTALMMFFGSVQSPTSYSSGTRPRSAPANSLLGRRSRAMITVSDPTVRSSPWESR